MINVLITTLRTMMAGRSHETETDACLMMDIVRFGSGCLLLIYATI